MAIIVDPDNLDRKQVIFGSENQKISLFPVGALVHASLSERSTGVTTVSTLTFSDAGATFQTWGVSGGDIVCIFTSSDAGHYVVDTVDDENTITVLAQSGDFSSFAGNTSIVYDIRQETGGSITDGVTEQAVYSFAKEEWRTDSETYGSDDLIRHPFPFEAITREQMEIGGGSSHDDWTWFNEYTRKKVRTGGWADKNEAAATLREWTGIITLGTLDTDTQVYYQQISSAQDPTDFTFTGTVNEAIQVWESGDDRRAYLKLFARKKAKTYAGSEISDIGVTSLETIVNRFPLSHLDDAAISATDGQILGTAPFRNQGSALESGSNGSITIDQFTFNSSGALFQTNGVQPGDTLQITSGGQQGYYTISVVNTEEQITIRQDWEFSGWTATENTLNYSVTSTKIISGRTDGVTDGTYGVTDQAKLTSATGGFSGTIAANDLLLITESGLDFQGVYIVASGLSDTELAFESPDITISGVSNVDFDIVEPGMYLQYKSEEIIEGPSTGDLTFSNDNPDTINRQSGSWITDGVEVGDIVTVANSTSNDGSYTVASLVASGLTLVSTDSLTYEVVSGGLGTDLVVSRGFRRVVDSVTYGFNWKLTGNNATLANCYQFVQHQLRQTTDIDWGFGTSRGDVTDLLMQFSSPTGTTFNLYIDSLNAADVNNVTWTDITGTQRLEKFVAAGSIAFNINLRSDASAEYTMFFTNDDAGDDAGADYGTPDAIIVQDNDSNPIAGSVGGAASVSFTYDYNGNVQRGAGSAGQDAPVTIVAIGLNTAQFVLLTGTIEETKTNNFSLVAALERNYSDPGP